MKTSVKKDVTVVTVELTGDEAVDLYDQIPYQGDRTTPLGKFENALYELIAEHDLRGD